MQKHRRWPGVLRQPPETPKEERPCLDADVVVSVKRVPGVESHSYVRLVVVRGARRTTTLHQSSTFFVELQKAMREDGSAELVKAKYPSLPRTNSLSSLGRKAPPRGREGRAAQLDQWLQDVVRLAQWGCLSSHVVALLDALLQHHDDTDSTDDERLSSSPTRDDDNPRRGRRLVDDRTSATTRGRASKKRESERIRELEAIVDSLTAQLRGGKEESSLEDLEAELKAAAAALLAGDASAEADLDRLDAAIKAHPEYAERVARDNAAWELAERDANERALATTRRVVPRSVATSSAADLEAVLACRGVGVARRTLAKRLLTTQALWLVWLPTDHVKKLHPSDLRNRYAAAGLDLVELRAVYAAVPTTFDNDAAGLKARWRDDLRAKLVEVVAKEHAGTLLPNERRAFAFLLPVLTLSAGHAAYRDLPPGLDVNDPTTPPPKQQASLLPETRLAISPASVADFSDQEQQQQQRRRTPPARRDHRRCVSLKTESSDLMAAIQRRAQLRAIADSS